MSACSLGEWSAQTVPMECELCESTLQCSSVLLGAGEGLLMQEDLSIFPTQFDRSVCFPRVTVHVSCAITSSQSLLLRGHHPHLGAVTDPLLSEKSY